jgi:hypothetical protein
MEHYVGLDASLKLTSICIVDRTGKVERAKEWLRLTRRRSRRLLNCTRHTSFGLDSRPEQRRHGCGPS